MVAAALTAASLAAAPALAAAAAPRRPRRATAAAAAGAGARSSSLQHVGGTPLFAFLRQRISMRGVVSPYVAGQSVKVSIYRDSRKVGCSGSRYGRSATAPVPSTSAS